MVVSNFKQATRYDIEQVVQQAKKLEVSNVELKENCQILNVKEASNILYSSIDKDALEKNQVEELMDNIEPFIFGGTPMYEALNEAVRLMTDSYFADYNKLLFVLSDGEPSDSGNIDKIKQEFESAGITVVCCYVGREAEIEPRRLFSKKEANWGAGADFLYQLSSKLTTEIIPRTIFLKQGWQFDIENNETKLFLQVNHPDNIHDVCIFARNVVCCQDALADLLASVDLDIYINQKTSGLKACEFPQEDETCYAYASAAVLYLAMIKILGRDGGYPDFEELRCEIILKNGNQRKNTFKVLEDICPKCRLHCKQVDSGGALNAVSLKRPVVATFRLTESQWVQFCDFYRRNPKGILGKNDLDISKRNHGHSSTGHAVVLTSYNSQCLRFMNSWGSDWADMGFFRVQNAEVLDFKFIDVYWTSADLSKDEKLYYGKHGSTVAKQLIQTLKGLQYATYKCDKCGVVSNINEYTGNMSVIRCPKCYCIFIVPYIAFEVT